MPGSNPATFTSPKEKSIGVPEASVPERQTSLEVGGNAEPESFVCETRLGISAQWSVTQHEYLPREEMLTAEY